MEMGSPGPVVAHHWHSLEPFPRIDPTTELQVFLKVIFLYLDIIHDKYILVDMAALYTTHFPLLTSTVISF